jgi:hypothetical protein
MKHLGQWIRPIIELILLDFIEIAPTASRKRLMQYSRSVAVAAVSDFAHSACLHSRASKAGD